MRRQLLSLLAATMLLASVPLAVSAQSAPEFQGGFLDLAAEIPDVVGQPVENERFDPATGQSTQRTTTGLMVWTKATNTPSFTDGATTWLNGPSGLQVRPNNERFAWEGPDSLASLPEGALQISFQTADGQWVGNGTLVNPTGSRVNVEINLVALDSSGAYAVGDAPTMYIQGLEPGASRQINVQLSGALEAASWRAQVVTTPSSAQDNLFLDVNTTQGLDIAPPLVGAAQALRGADGGDWLLRVAAENGVSIQSAATPAGVLGAYFPASNEVVISSGLNIYSAQVRAAVLAHELQHAAQAAAGELPSTPGQCIAFERSAFGREAEVWSALWGGNLPPPTNAAVAELNDVTTTITSNPAEFNQELIQRYGADCGLVP